MCSFFSCFVRELIKDHGGPLSIHGKAGEQKHGGFTIAPSRDTIIHAVWLLGIYVQKVPCMFHVGSTQGNQLFFRTAHETILQLESNKDTSLSFFVCPADLDSENSSISINHAVGNPTLDTVMTELSSLKVEKWLVAGGQDVGAVSCSIPFQTMI